MKILDTRDRNQAYHVLRATLHAVRDRIGPENAVHLGAQLPTLLRGVYYEGWRMGATSTTERNLARFLEHVKSEMPPGPAIAIEPAVRAVFWVMYDKIDHGEIAKLRKMFPATLRDLWPPVETLAEAGTAERG